MLHWLRLNLSNCSQKNEKFGKIKRLQMFFCLRNLYEQNDKCLLRSALDLAGWLQKGIPHCQKCMICKMDTGLCDTEKTVQLICWGRALPHQSQIYGSWDRWMQTLPSITTGVKHHLPSVTLMNNTGCNGSLRIERSVNTHHCFWLFLLFLLLGRFFLFFHPVL